MTERTRGPANRSHFERWFSDWTGGLSQARIRNARTEFGYIHSDMDIAWAAWNAALELAKLKKGKARAKR